MNVQSAVPAWLQILWAVAGICVAVGGAAWIMFIFYPYIRWSRSIMQAGFDQGTQTAGLLKKLQEDLSPVIVDLKSAVKDAREIVKELREKELDKIVRALDKVTENGALEGALDALRKIPERLESLLKQGKKDFLKNL